MSSEKMIEPLADSIIGASTRLGISRASVYREITSGRLKSIKVGKRRLVTRAAQEAWLAALEQVAP